MAVVLLIRLDLEHRRRRQHEVGVRRVGGREAVDRDEQVERGERPPPARRFRPGGEDRRAADDHAAHRVGLALEDRLRQERRVRLPAHLVEDRELCGSDRRPCLPAGAGVTCRCRRSRSGEPISLPPGESRWPAIACRVSAARIACTPEFEYSRPVYMRIEQPAAVPTACASSRTVSAGTPVIASTRSGAKSATYGGQLVEAVREPLDEGVVVAACLRSARAASRARARRRCRAGCRPTRQRSARAVSERRGSITTTRPPRACSRFRRTRFSGGDAVAGLAPQTSARSACVEILGQVAVLLPKHECGAIIP